MAMAMAVCNTQQRLSDVNADVVKYFMEKLLVQIFEHFDGHELIDVTFKLSNPTALVTAHRLILSAASPYLRELFKSAKGICPLIEITEIDSDTFERLITFCYTGKTLITLENVDEMLKAAIILQLDDVVANCVDFIIDHITDYTLQRAYALETETQNDLLSQKILKYEINCKEIFQSTEFLSFDAKKMETILESDDLNVKCEKDVFKAVKRWYEYDPSARKQQLPNLIGLLRLTQFDTNYIMTNILSLPGCQVLALETVAWINSPVARSKLNLKYTKPRKSRGAQSEITEEFLALNIKEGSIYQYNKTEDFWYKKDAIEINATAFRVIYTKESLVFIGGMRNFVSIDEVSSWNLRSKTYKRLPSMKEPRYHHSIVLLDDKIYAIGGRGISHEVLQSMEMYSDYDGWQRKTSMLTARSWAAAVTLNGKIYVMGGDDGVCPLKSVERYDPTIDCWTKCADMHYTHSFHGATVHNGKIYVVGGWDQYNHRRVERYDEQRNEWTKICCLGIGMTDLVCISIYNQLWAVGGWDKYYVSVYDEQNDKWITKSPMPSVGPYYCFKVAKALL